LFARFYLDFARVNFVYSSLFRFRKSKSTEKFLFVSDVLPTAWWSVENAGVKEGDTVIVLGSGPVGLMTQRFAKMKGAERVIAVDNVPHRLEHSAQNVGVETLNFDDYKIPGKALKEITNGGADIFIDCVGMDGTKRKDEKVTNLITPQRGTSSPIETAGLAVKKFGTIQLTGAYLFPVTNFMLNNLFARNITLKMGQAPVVHLMPKLFDMIQENQFNPTEIITHIMPFEEAATPYEMFDKKEDDNIKFVLRHE